MGSWTEFQLEFGRCGGGRQLPDAVWLFFANGGRRAVVSRAVRYADAQTARLRFDAVGGASDPLTFYAANPGAWGNSLRLTWWWRQTQLRAAPIALGLVARGVGERPDAVAYGELRSRILDTLRKGFDEDRGDPRNRGAWAVALGLMKDDRSIARLTAVVSNRDGDRELRGYAALAVGMIGVPERAAVEAIRNALRERSSEELRLQCATGLGLLAAPGTVDLLLKELAETDSQFVQGQVVLALAQIGDARTIPPLLAILRDGTRPEATRAIACAGLGLLGDLERRASLSLLTTGLNYRAVVDAVTEVFSIL